MHGCAPSRKVLSRAVSYAAPTVRIADIPVIERHRSDSCLRPNCAVAPHQETGLQSSRERRAPMVRELR